MPSKIKKQIRFYFRLSLDTFFFSWQIFFRRPTASILLSIASPERVGGTEFQVNKLAEYLAKKGQKILVLTIGRTSRKKTHPFFKRLQNHQIPYLDMGNLGFAKNIFLQKYALYLLKQCEASTLQIFNPSCANLIPLAKKANLKIIYIETGLPSIDRWWAPLAEHIPSIDLTLAVSKSSLDHFLSLFHYKGPTAILQPLLDLPPQTLPKSPLRPSEGLNIVYFGRIYRQKGVRHLLEAFLNLLVKFPSSHLTFIGEGPDKKHLQQQVIAWNIESQVRFIDFQTKEVLFEKLSEFDLFCLPSLSEGTPCAILEAMSIGLPVVASRIGGIPEIIDDRISGMLVSPDDLDSLTQVLCLLAREPHLLSKLKINGLKRYKKYLAAQKNQLSKIYRSRSGA